MNWPRDADRLPDGHTLVTISNSNRVVEVDADGEVVWEVALTRPYEAERFETGDESAGGQSAASLGLQSRIDGAGGPSDPQTLVGRLTSSPIYQAVLFVLPWWMGVSHPVALLGAVGISLAWVGLELSWTDRKLPRLSSSSSEETGQ